ncbi:MAG: hypothetical protein ABI863_14645 [Ginsengibacter sp.]
MITDLEEVISKVELLEDAEQRQLAKMLSDELNWDTTLQNSREKLGDLAKEALTEYQAGKTQQTNWY